MRRSRQKLNEIINLRGADGQQIDIFSLHGVLFLGNTRDGQWDINKTYTRYAEHRLPFEFQEFDDCKTEDDVRERFAYLLIDNLKRLL